MSHFKTDPNGHALYVPELLNLVTDLLDAQDWLALMQTCRSIFPTIASRVWKEVAAQVIMDLIVETRQISDDRLGGWEGINESSIFDFSRFDVYAPFVKHILVYSRTASSFSNERRRIYVQRAKEGTFLPNAISITLVTSHPGLSIPEYLFWTDVLFNPSLRELNIEATTDSAWLSHLIVSDLLDKLTTTYSALEKLEFYPQATTRSYDAGDTDNFTMTLWPLSPHDLSSCVRLRSITSSIYILSGNGFVSLGALPQLESLTLHWDNNQPTGLQFSVPVHSFPSLTHLNLLDADTTNLPAIMGVEQLTSGLESLEITQNLGREGYHQEHWQRWLTRVLPCLFEHTSRLKSLKYDVAQRSQHRNYSSIYTVEPRPLLRAFSRMPLQHVSLVGIGLGLIDLFEYIPTAFPQVMSFELPHQGIHSAELPLLAKIPNLRRLILGQTSLTVLPPMLPDPHDPLEVVDATVTPMIFGAPIDGEQAARFLLLSWPNLRRVNRWRPVRKYKESDWEFAVSEEMETPEIHVRISRFQVNNLA
ncbi:hypothetical protein FRC12_002664 [Ceratobasidium sp. 428]|nr:hypothetical protein FRC12_002664 [Ceratobasidium sp. 428]